MKQFTISKNDANQRLDKFLSKVAPKLPASLMYKAIRTKDVKINGKRAEISTRLNVGDVVSAYLKDEFFEEVKRYPNVEIANLEDFGEAYSYKVLYDKQLEDGFDLGMVLELGYYYEDGCFNQIKQFIYNKKHLGICRCIFQGVLGQTCLFALALAFASFASLSRSL